MALDGILAIQARINEIQQQFAAVPTSSASTTSTAASLAATSTALGDSPDFASQLAAALGTDSSTTGTSTTGNATRSAFVATALAENGKPYVWGATAKTSDPNPPAFDCSELTKWAAARVGVTIPDGAVAQYLDLKQHGTLMSVDQALHTPGALLFSFSHEPTGPNDIPEHAHVAISLGNGKTIEARGKDYGTGVFDATGRFQYAGVIPGMS